MKKTQKIFVISILIFSILFLTIQKNYAVENGDKTTNNETQQDTPSTENKKEDTTTKNNVDANNNTNNVQNNAVVTNNQPTTSKPTTSNTTNITTTTTDKTTTAKSSNANLTTLGIKPAQYDFTGFNNNTTSYNVKVPESIETIQIFAKVQDSKAKLEGTGSKTLQIGKNILEVTVTAEDGTKKVYTINVTRGEGAIEKEDEEGLKELSVEGATLSPEFSATTYEYTVKYIGEETKLEITTEPAQSDYIVEVIGNNDLQEGENIITILVSDKNGGNVATYQLIVNKSLIDVEAIERQKAEEQEKREKIIIGIIIGILIIAFIIYIVIKHKRNKKNPDTSTYYDKYEDDDDEENNNEEEMPKALKNKKNQKSEEKVKNDDVNIKSNKESDEDEEKKHKGKRFK